MLFVKVAESAESPEESVEIPVEPDGFILMSTLTAQFPGACGLKYKTEQSSWRGVRVVDDKIYPPGDEQWDSEVYVVTYPKDAKRKGDDLDINSAKSRKIERKCVDLIVLGIPWKSSEEVVRRYFEQYGEVVLCEIKKDATNNSKGFGFVRFKEYQNQCSVLGKKHFIDGRWCDVKIPNSQEPETSRKIFVGRLSEQLTAKDLQEYFAQYGQVIDVYIPKPFRAFGFVTFVEADIAQGLCGESHIIKGVSVHVSRADPKEEENGSHFGAGPNAPHHPPHHQMNSHGHHPHQQHHHHGPMKKSASAHVNGNNGHHFGYHSNGSGQRGGGPGPNMHEQNKRFAPNGHHHHHPHMGSSKSNGALSGPPNRSGGGGGGAPRTKYDHLPHSFNEHSHHGGRHHQSPYESRHHDVRSPNMPPVPVPPPPHHHGANNGPGAQSQSQNAPNGDQMNAMMNMFNPMMAAFLQQLATQSNLSQSPMDNAGPNSGPLGNGPVLPPPGGHHHHHHHQGPPPPWTQSPGLHGPSGGFHQPQHSNRVKNEKF